LQRPLRLASLARGPQQAAICIAEVPFQFGVAGAIARFFTVSRVWGNVPGGMIFDFVNKNNLL
jgi:hypothetical protein